MNEGLLSKMTKRPLNAAYEGGSCPGDEIHNRGRFRRKRSFLATDGNDAICSAAVAGALRPGLADIGYHPRSGFIVRIVALGWGLSGVAQGGQYGDCKGCNTLCPPGALGYQVGRWNPRDEASVL